MYANMIFGIDGSFRFGQIVISHDIYIGTIAMTVVDALVRRAKRQSEFHVVLYQEGPDWILNYIERPSMAKAGFLMFEFSDGLDNGEEKTVLYSEPGVSLWDFAERVVHDLSFEDLADTFSPTAAHDFLGFYKYEDLKRKLDELKDLMKDKHVFDSIGVDELCNCKSVTGESDTFEQEKVSLTEEEKIARVEKYLNDYGMRTLKTEDGWFLTNVLSYELCGPDVDQSCAQEMGCMIISDRYDKYRTIPKAECRLKIEKKWPNESAKVAKLLSDGYSYRDILCMFEIWE